MIEILETIVGLTNKYIWAVLVYVLLGAGLYFTVRGRFLQVRLFMSSIRRMIFGKRSMTESISPFQAFATGLASRVGTGNIAGVAIAIHLGGAGAIFWMWVTSLIGMSSAFVESTLAQLFKVRNKDKSFRGGPAYYITQGLGQHWLAVLFALSLIMAFGFIFNSVQANTIAQATNKAWGFDSRIVGLVLVLFTAPIIFGGIKRVAKFSEIIVPIMAIIYLLVAGFIIIKNITALPEVFALIFREAFNFKAAAGGMFGALSIGMINGIKRGLFSNEAGMGSAPNAAAASDAQHPASQGLIQMLGVFVDTILVCSCTAFIILVSGVVDSGAEGVKLTQMALTSQIGDFGSSFLAILLLMFCFSSVMGNYSYAESNVMYIKNNKIVLFMFRLFVLVMVYFGAVQKVGLVWDMADASMGVMALINLVAIILLSPIAFTILKDFEDQKKQGVKNPEFDINKYPELKKKLEHPEIWEK